MLLAFLLNTLDGLFEFFIVLIFQFLLALISLGLGGGLFVSGSLGLFAFLVNNALVLVSEFQQREELTTTGYLQVLTSQLKVIWW